MIRKKCKQRVVGGSEKQTPVDVGVDDDFVIVMRAPLFHDDFVRYCLWCVCHRYHHCHCFVCLFIESCAVLCRKMAVLVERRGRRGEKKTAPNKFRNEGEQTCSSMIFSSFLFQIYSFFFCCFFSGLVCCATLLRLSKQK